MSDVGDIIFRPETIEGKVRELAALISRDYKGRELVLVGILKGAVVFLSDLMRHLTIPATVEFVRAYSYGTSSVPSESITVDLDTATDITGKDLLLVDTIVDTGKTLFFLLGRYAERGPASVKAAVLLDKKSRRTVEVPLAYCGFIAPDRFLVGYGLDFAEENRTLPYIAAIRISPSPEIPQ